MTKTHFSTSDRKSKHLSFKDRSQIELLKQQGYSNRAIARMLRPASQMIHNEIKRGTIEQIRQQTQHDKVYTYQYSKSIADVAQKNLIISVNIMNVSLFGHSQEALLIRPISDC